MVRYGPTLESQQMSLKRLVDVGTEIFVITSCCARAQYLMDRGKNQKDLLRLVDFACRESKLHIAKLFRDLSRNNDRSGYQLAGQILDGELAWLEEGIVHSSFE